LLPVRPNHFNLSRVDLSPINPRATLVSKQVNLPQKTVLMETNTNADAGDARSAKGSEADFVLRFRSALKCVRDSEASAERIRRARLLVAQKGYPSEEICRKVAGLLARHLEPDQASDSF
jgi:hypothetical protein